MSSSARRTFPANTFYSFPSHIPRLQDIRDNMRKMGELSGVPIEPPEQTALLDACVGVAGVIGGGVPGAGGYDAIWLLVCDPPNRQVAVRPPSSWLPRAG